MGAIEVIERFRAGEMNGDTNKDYSEWPVRYARVKDGKERSEGYRKSSKIPGTSP